MINIALKAMAKVPKQVIFFIKISVIITHSKVKTYIFKKNFLFLDSLTFALRATVSKTKKKELPYFNGIILGKFYGEVVKMIFLMKLTI